MNFLISLLASIFGKLLESFPNFLREMFATKEEVEIKHGNVIEENPKIEPDISDADLDNYISGLSGK